MLYEEYAMKPRNLPARLALVALAFAATACTTPPMPAPVVGDRAGQPTQVAPTDEPTRTPTSAPPTATPTRRPPTPTPRPTRAPVQPTATRARPTATPTPLWPRTLVIDEEQIEALAAGSAMPGLEISGLDATFGDETMTISFDNLRYGIISLRNVTVSGHFTVSNGTPTFVADSIQPRNLATAAIPNFVNQALAQQFADWYVEDLSIMPGMLAVVVHPR
jgi:hypothetical protein